MRADKALVALSSRSAWFGPGPSLRPGPWEAFELTLAGCLHLPVRDHRPYLFWSDNRGCSGTNAWQFATFPRRRLPAFLSKASSVEADATAGEGAAGRPWVACSVLCVCVCARARARAHAAESRRRLVRPRRRGLAGTCSHSMLWCDSPQDAKASASYRGSLSSTTLHIPRSHRMSA
jgi:hypothetical protein